MFIIVINLLHDQEEGNGFEELHQEGVKMYIPKTLLFN